MDHPSKHDDKARAILNGAAKVFSEKGYHHASMRDIARETGMSLAGMYHYFSGKEEILFSILRFCFRGVLDLVEEKIAPLSDPMDKLQAIVYHHLQFFTQNVTEMRVLSHEAESLSGEYGEHIHEMMREYYNLLADVLEELHGGGWTDGERRRATLSVFGMINWIYTWYRPDRDGDAEELASTMMGILTDGIVPAKMHG